MASCAVLLVGIAIPLLLHKKFPNQASAASTVPGQNYQICGQDAAQYLTSPWTYHALASGSQSYTVAQYQALPGYGTTLPPLPAYIASQASTTVAAVIHAPGSDTAQPQYFFPNTPIIHFYEGGVYGAIVNQAVSGNQYIGGSAPGFPEPTFDNGGGAGGISAQNDSYDYPNNTTAISHLSSAAAQGATTVTLTGATLPLMKWGNISIAGHTYTISDITGTQSGYTVTVTGGLDMAAVSNAPVYYAGNAGAVTVSYLDISHDLHNTTGTIYTGSGWTISHNNFHDFYNASPGLGVAVYGGDEGVIEYNCFSKMGDYAANIFGHNNKFRMNEVYDSNFSPDPGCGCSGAGKWWGTLNADITDNAWINNSHGGSLVIWLDNGNAGTLISGNFFDKSAASAVHSETGFNLNITNNIFQNGGWGSGNGCGDSNCVGAINLNSSGGFHVPGSRYDNQISVTYNQFINNWGGIDIWQSGSRSCNNSGEGGPEDASYCSGGFPITTEPISGGQYYFSHFGNSTNQGGTQVAQAAAAGSTTLLVSGAMAINDQIDFTNDVVKTTTSSTTNVTALSGSSTINAVSTASFPSSGQLRVGTSAAWADGGLSYTGAILSYTGKTATSFTGVSLVRGSGTLAGPVWQVQPYKVVSQSCFSSDCALTISPALASPVSAGAYVSNAGTCQLFATSAATPASPLAPNGTSYFDGCQWGTAHITVSNNIFIFDPAFIAAGTTVDGHVGTTCTAGHANSCGTNFMAFQESGQPPFSSFIGGNAMFSNSLLTTCPSWDSGCTTNPLKNLNALSNAPNAPAANNEAPSNNVWSNNTYQGPWLWNAYVYGSCNFVPSDPQTGKSMAAGSCQSDFTHWQSNWQQDAGSTYTASVTYNTSLAEDINQDGHINFLDLSILASKYGQSGAAIGRSDINSDGIVNFLDLSQLASKYGSV
jgi:hypothetical protein